jgi:predicted outer membrane lipoprotein
MPQPKPVNPFYFALVLVGVLFALSACAFGVMTVRGLEPANSDEAGLMGFLDQYGLWLLVGELALLALLTVAAIGTDDYWTRTK